MLVFSAVPVFIVSALAVGPFRDSIPSWVDNLAQLGIVLSLFVLVCALEAGSGGRSKDTTGSA